MSRPTSMGAASTAQEILVGDITPNPCQPNVFNLQIHNFEKREEPPVQPAIVIEIEDSTMDTLLSQQPTVVIRRINKYLYTPEDLNLAFHLVTTDRLRPVEAHRYFGIPYNLFFREWRKYKVNPTTYVPDLTPARRRRSVPNERNVISGGFNLFSPGVGMFLKGKYTAIVPS